MTVELTFPWAPVKALAHLANAEDIRPWTRGVWLDSSAPALHVVATNGTVLGVYLTEDGSTHMPPVFIPLHIIKACKGFGPTALVRIDDTGHAMLDSFGTRHYWQDEKLVLVDYRRAFPQGACTGNVQQFNTDELQRFAKVRTALGAKASVSPVRISHNARPKEGIDAALVTLADVPRFAGVVMSLREKPDQVLAPTNAPGWVFERADTACDLA